VVQQFGNERHKHFIPTLMSGASSSGSFCLSEAGSGSDAAAMQANARKTESGFVLNGNKAWITSGQYAGAYLVWARVDGGGKDSISVFFVDKDTPGVSFGSPEAKMGQHASNTVVVSFDDVELAADAVLGEVGQGFKVAMMALDGGRIGIASQAIGIADAMLDEARKVVEVPLHWTARLEAARMLVWRAAFLKERKKPFTFEASMAKLHASETACAIGDAMLLATQSAGFDSCLLDKLVRDARVTRIYEGTSEVQRIVIAREMDKRTV
jgi:alkylation response protein AidB-like acyl-CoA dehydrogenase